MKETNIKRSVTVGEFETAIRALPEKKKYTREDLLVPPFLLEEENSISIYYAPHNEYINPEAKVFIIGITPGFEQMGTALAAAKKGFEEGKTIEEIQYACKVAARFSGTLRKNIIYQLGQIGLPEVLGIESAEQLFAERDDLLHTISLIPYSVFVKGKNYTGHTPKLIKSPFLMKYVYENFLWDYEQLEYPEQVILIPLGKAVEEVLYHLADEGKIKREQILCGFPHPSGANVNRLKELEKNKESMRNFLTAFGKDNG